MFKQETPIWRDASTVLLLATNLLTIYFAVTQGWEIGTVLFVYWGQTFANAFFYFFRIGIVSKRLPADGVVVNGEQVSHAPGLQSFLSSFFLLHFGGFLLMYLIFIMVFFEPNFVEGLPLIGVFFVNHAFSFFYTKNDLSNMSQALWNFFMPYIRNIPMHIIIAAAAITSRAGIWAVVAFLLLKTLIDVILHVAEHRYFRKKTISVSTNF